MQLKYLLYVLLALLTACAIYIGSSYVNATQEWVRYRYGERCWPKGFEPHGTYRVYYSSLTLCERSFGE